MKVLEEYSKRGNKMKTQKPSKSKLTLKRKHGIILIIIGIAMQFLNIITYGLWQIDIDIFGVLIFLIGLVIMAVRWKVR